MIEEKETDDIYLSGIDPYEEDNDLESFEKFIEEIKELKKIKTQKYKSKKIIL